MTTEVRVAVLAGGGVGTLLRWLVAEVVDVTTFPLATLLVNLLGAYLLGRLSRALPDAPASVRAFLGAGLLGSFTTFSAIVVDVVALGFRPGLLVAYAGVTVAGGIWLARLGRDHGGVSAESRAAPDAEVAP